jgi:outer membrane protein
MSTLLRSAPLRSLVGSALLAVVTLGVQAANLSEASAQPTAAPVTPAQAPTSHVQATATRIAVIDTRRVILETEEGLRVQANLRKLFDARQQELGAKEKQLIGEQEDIKREEKAKGRSDALERRKAEFIAKKDLLNQTMVEYQREMQRKEGELTAPMLQRVGAIVKRLAASEGYDIIIERQVAPYFRTDLEVTDKVIQQYNAGDTGAAKPGAPAKPAPKAPAAPPAKKP